MRSLTELTPWNLYAFRAGLVQSLTLCYAAAIHISKYPVKGCRWHYQGARVRANDETTSARNSLIGSLWP
jgi:hypothetical protein